MKTGSFDFYINAIEVIHILRGGEFMYETVSNATIMGMAISMVIAILFPTILLVYWQISKKPKFISAVLGAHTLLHYFYPKSFSCKISLQ